MNDQLFKTEIEMAAQPAIWLEWSAELAPKAEEISAWIKSRRPDVIWLCGAGTSAFIGDSLATQLDGKLDGIPVRALPTTDFVARPRDYLKPGLRPLVVSFGRSGDSSETVGTLKILDRDCPEADQLNITCNPESFLATHEKVGSGQTRVIVLPAQCHDEGFAMTSSYTTMLLTALACLSNSSGREIESAIGKLSQEAASLLNRASILPRPERAVFLGSGPFFGTAKESALKVLELAAGKVVTDHESSLGFRHGPKAIVNEQTLVTVFLSNEELTRKYDVDIASEIRQQFPDSRVVTIGQASSEITPDIQVNSDLPDVWNTVLYVLAAQIWSIDWSKSLSLNVDNPFEGGNLSRVVSHVTLY